ncbi:MAG: O-antigen ligase family protein [Candidatus Melainabacteria bacterium]|nr:O-antigen ligase family protein [Candidatus Melainabacteria bacterium]
MKNLKIAIREKNVFVKIGFLVVVLLLAYMFSLMSIYGISSEYFTPVIILLILVLSFLNWRKATLFLIIWVLFSGAVRKWVLPELADVVFFFNHIILIGIYAGYFNEQLRTRSLIIFKHPMNIFLLFFFIWGVACSINPRSPSIFIGLLGVVLHFFYIPLIFIIPYIFNTKEELFKVLRIFVYFSFPILILGVIQFFSPLESPINKYVAESDVVPMGNFPRISSTFPFISGYATYLHILSLVLIYFISLKNIPNSQMIIYYLLLALSILNLFMTGSRSGMFISIFSGVLYLAISGALNADNLKRYLFRFIIAGGIFFLIATSPLGSHAINAFISRFDESDEIVRRVTDIYTIPLDYLKESGVYGFGIGGTYQGSFSLLKTLKVAKRDLGVAMNVEEEPLRILLEIGLFGFIMVYLIRFLMVKYFWELYLKLQDEDIKHFALACTLYLFPFFINIHRLVFDQTAHLFYWFTVGFLFLLPRLDKKNIASDKKALI